MSKTFEDELGEEVTIKGAPFGDLIEGLRETIENDFTPYLGHEDGKETVDAILDELKRQYRKKK